MTSIQTGVLPFRTKLSYGLGSAAFGIKDQGFAALLMLYYNQVLGLPAAGVATAIMIAMVVDALVDPLIGNYSDHFRSRWGRRHPFMYASALPIAIGYLLLWSPPHASQTIQFAWLVVTAIGVRVAISLYEIPSAALLTEFTSNYNERTALSTYRAMFQSVANVAMAVLTFKVFFKATAEQPMGQLNPAGYTTYAVVAAITMFVCVLLSTAGTHRRIPLLQVPESTQRHGIRDMFAGLRGIFFDRTYASIFFCNLFFSVAVGLITALNAYICTYVWLFNAEQIGAVVGSGAIGLVLAMVIVQLAKKIDKKGITIVLFLIGIAISAVPLVLRLLGHLPTDPAVLLPYIELQFAVFITAVIAALILLISMVADVGDHFQLKTGRRMEGLMFSSVIMVNKAVSGMGVFMSGMVLGFVHFPDKAVPGAVDAGIIDQLSWIYVASTTIFLLLAMVALAYYPITRAVHQNTLRKLAEA